MNVASGLHHRLVDEPELVTLAQASGVELFDLRHMRPALNVGSGKKRSGKRILTVGTDCSVGKMYTSLALEAAMRARGLKADFRATGRPAFWSQGRALLWMRSSLILLPVQQKRFHRRMTRTTGTSLKVRAHCSIPPMRA